MKTAIVFDCEFLCLQGSQRRYWCAPHDPDPVVVQIGAVKLGLEGDFPLLGTHMDYVTPVDRYGQRYDLDPFFTQLTGIASELIETKGVSLSDALLRVDSFSEGSRLWSWGKDELNMVAISAYVQGIEPIISPRRFDNAVKLMMIAGMPFEDVVQTPSSKLAHHFGLSHPPLREHDARDDALSIAYTLQHLLKLGKLTSESFDR